MDLAGKMFREWPTVAGLAKLTRNLRIVIPTVVTIALLLLLFQQGFCVLGSDAQWNENSR